MISFLTFSKSILLVLFLGGGDGVEGLTGDSEISGLGVLLVVISGTLLIFLFNFQYYKKDL